MIGKSFGLLGQIASQVAPESEPPYQIWDGYPDSPVLTADYPYQFISTRYGTVTLTYSDHRPWAAAAGAPGAVNDISTLHQKVLNSGNWIYSDDVGNRTFDKIYQCNYDIYYSGNDHIIQSENNQLTNRGVTWLDYQCFKEFQFQKGSKQA